MAIVTERRVEQLYPWLGAVIVGGTLGALLPEIVFKRGIDKLVEPVIAVSAIGVGFLLTVSAMLGQPDRPAPVQELADIGALETLLGYLKASIYAWGTVALWTMMVAVVEPHGADPLVGIRSTRWLGAVWAALIALGFLTSHRVARIMFALLRTPPRRRRKPDQEPIRRIAP